MTPDEERENMIKAMRFDEGRKQDLTPEEARRRMLGYLRLDAEGDDEGEEERTRDNGSKPHYGNTRLPYGLCKRFGIDLAEGATPRDAWQALEKGTGYSHDQVMKIVERTGSTKEVGSNGGAKTGDEGAGKGATKGANGAKGSNEEVKRKPLRPMGVPKHMTIAQCDEYCKEKFGEKSDLTTDADAIGLLPSNADKILGALGAVEEKFGVRVNGVVAKDNVSYDKDDMPKDNGSATGVYIDNGIFYIDKAKVHPGKKSIYEKGAYANYYKGEKERAEKNLQEAKELYEKYKNDWNGYGSKYHPAMEATHNGENSFQYWQMVQRLVPDAERKKEKADRDYERFKNTPHFVGDPERPEETCVYEVVGRAIADSLRDCAKYFKGRDLAEVSMQAYEQREDLFRTQSNLSKYDIEEIHERAAQKAFSECFIGCMLGMDMPEWCYDMVDDAGKRLKEMKAEREKNREKAPEKIKWRFPDPTELYSSTGQWRLFLDSFEYGD